MKNPLYELYKKRFGEKFTSNLCKNNEFQLDFSSDFVTDSPNKCQECAATKFRQDLPFWIGDVQKDFMIIAQDAGKGEGDDFNTVFSIHKAYNNIDVYKNNKKHDNYFTYLNKLVSVNDKNEINFFKNVFFTDLVKCAFSSSKDVNISFKEEDKENRKTVQCHTDILTEIATVNPKIVYLFGQKPRDTFKKLITNKFKDKKINNIDSHDIIINKGRKTSIQLFEHPEFNDILFISVPQLGNNRFSLEGYSILFEFLDNKLKPIIAKHISKRD